MDIQKEWRKFLIDIGKSGAEVARDLKQTPANVNKKFSNESIKLREFVDILNMYGYDVQIIKRND